MESAQRASIAGLRDALRRITKEGEPAPRENLPTGWTSLDELLGGGLPRGRVIEIAGARSSGKTSVALGAATRTTQAGRLVAYVDARRELYPPAAATAGVDLARLLIVRPPPTTPAIVRAAEIVAQSRAFALVIIDLPDGRMIEGTVGARLRSAAHDSDTAIVVLASRPATSVAATALDVRRARLGAGAAWERADRGAGAAWERADRGAGRDAGTGAVATLRKGGAAPPGTRTTIAIGEALASSAFRPAAQQVALAALGPDGPDAHRPRHAVHGAVATRRKQ